MNSEEGQVGPVNRREKLSTEPVDKSVDNFLDHCLTVHGYGVNNSLMTF